MGCVTSSEQSKLADASENQDEIEDNQNTDTQTTQQYQQQETTYTENNPNDTKYGNNECKNDNKNKDRKGKGLKLPKNKRTFSSVTVTFTDKNNEEQTLHVAKKGAPRRVYDEDIIQRFRKYKEENKLKPYTFVPVKALLPSVIIDNDNNNGNGNGNGNSNDENKTEEKTTEPNKGTTIKILNDNLITGSNNSDKNDTNNKNVRIAKNGQNKENNNLPTKELEPIDFNPNRGIELIDDEKWPPRDMDGAIVKLEMKNTVDYEGYMEVETTDENGNTIILYIYGKQIGRNQSLKLVESAEYGAWWEFCRDPNFPDFNDGLYLIAAYRANNQNWKRFYWQAYDSSKNHRIQANMDADNIDDPVTGDIIPIAVTGDVRFHCQEWFRPDGSSYFTLESRMSGVGGDGMVSFQTVSTGTTYLRCNGIFTDDSNWLKFTLSSVDNS